MIIIEKLLASVFSSIILALVIPNGLNHFLPIVLVSLPVFLIAGTPYSLLVDYMLEKRRIASTFRKYLSSFLLYGIGGLLIITLYALVTEMIKEITIVAMLVLGLLPGLIYFHLSLLVRTILVKLKI